MKRKVVITIEGDLPDTEPLSVHVAHALRQHADRVALDAVFGDGIPAKGQEDHGPVRLRWDATSAEPLP